MRIGFGNVIRWTAAAVMPVVAIVVVVLMGVGLGPVQADTERVALVLGNGRYVNAAALPNAVNDARVMAGALRDIGFT